MHYFNTRTPLVINPCQSINTTRVSIKDEPMLYGASWNFAKENGGTITKFVMQVIEDDVKETMSVMAQAGYHPIIDTKSVLLMPGQYPCIPGWHCDGVVREEQGSQPNLNTLNDPIVHYLYTLSDCLAAGHASTSYMVDEIGIRESSVEKYNVWKSVDSLVRGLSEERALPRGKVLRFYRDTLHKCGPAPTRQWRYFFRCSFYHMPAMNEIRQQVQVYTDINQGW